MYSPRSGNGRWIASWQVCARMVALPPVLDEDAAENVEPGAPLPLKDVGPGYAALGSSGYADDTQAVALGAAALGGTVPATEEWLQITGQDIGTDKSCSWVHGEQGAPAVLPGESPSGWRRLSASSASTSPLGAPGSRGQCCPSAWKRDRAPFASSPTSPPMTAGSGLSARW